MSDIKEIINQGLKFYNKLREDENGRYRSWEYCYKIFYDAHISNNVDDDFIDYLCLHLSFYLAVFLLYDLWYHFFLFFQRLIHLLY